jgi:hypothetical protein
VADVAVPQCIGSLGLPPQPHARARAVTQREAVQALLLEEAAHGRLRDDALVEAAVHLQRPHDEGGGGLRVLPSDLAQQLTLLVGQMAASAPVAARFGLERIEPTGAVGVQPSLERRDGVMLGALGAGSAEPLRTERCELDSQFAVVELAVHEPAYDGRPEQRHLLGGVLRLQRLHD